MNHNINARWKSDCGYSDVDCLHWLDDAEFLLFINSDADISEIGATHSEDANPA